ncbi:hypothetical protein [Amaricoccus tamworthensis]|uniref:hypothetical protein n=1 Tax=Amaricoccus tamworthensis TaxID=57002 RepID=UPI003C7D8100
MFTANSRYADTPVTTAKKEDGEVSVVRLRRLPDTEGAPLAVEGRDRLDVICERCYQDGTRFWHVADANTELDAGDILTPPGRIVQVPED